MGQRTSQPTRPVRRDPCCYADYTCPAPPARSKAFAFLRWLPLFGDRYKEEYTAGYDLEKANYQYDGDLEEDGVGHPATYVRLKDEEWDLGFVTFDLQEFKGPSGEEFVGFPLIDDSRWAQQEDVRQQKPAPKVQKRHLYRDYESHTSYAESRHSRQSYSSHKSSKAPSREVASFETFISLDPELQIFVPPVIVPPSSQGLVSKAIQTSRAPTPAGQPSCVPSVFIQPPPPVQSSNYSEPPYVVIPSTSTAPPPSQPPLSTSSIKPRPKPPSPITEECEEIPEHLTNSSTSVAEVESVLSVSVNLTTLDDSQIISSLVQPYARYADLRSRTAGLPMRRMWRFISLSLATKSDGPISQDSGTLSIQRLLTLLRNDNHGNYFGIVHELESLSLHQDWRFRGIAREYFNEYGPIYCSIDIRNSLPSVFVSGQRIRIPLATLATGQYAVSSFFGAVHAVIAQTMPINRSLQEYVVILILITKLLSRLIEQVRPRMNPKKSKLMSTSIGLLVGQVQNSTRPLSMATIGFSACGNASQRKAQINLRKDNLPLLSEIRADTRVSEWNAGNCAEPELFAHCNGMQESLQRGAKKQDVKAKVIFTALILKLEKLDISRLEVIEGKEFCELCSELAQKMSLQLGSSIFDICPPP